MFFLFYVLSVVASCVPRSVFSDMFSRLSSLFCVLSVGAIDFQSELSGWKGVEVGVSQAQTPLIGVCARARRAVRRSFASSRRELRWPRFRRVRTDLRDCASAHEVPGQKPHACVGGTTTVTTRFVAAARDDTPRRVPSPGVCSFSF